MTQVLLVSKPVAPPWNDSSKNLVRDLARHMERHEPRVMGERGAEFELPQGHVEPLYPSGGARFAPGLRDNARVLGRLLTDRSAGLWHFFFAPNPRSSMAGRFSARLKGTPTVHTVCSAPRAERDAAKSLFADCTVVLSRHTEQRLMQAGVPADRLRRIPPGIEPLEPLDASARGRARRQFGLPEHVPLVVYAGDLEFGGGAERAVDAFAALGGDVHLAMACRAKTAAAQDVQHSLQDAVHRRGVSHHVSWIGQTPAIHALLGAADLVVLPSDDLYAKMDYPLVILEAMSLGCPVVVAEGTPAAELAEDGAVRAVEPRADALEHELRQLLEDRSQAQSLGERARTAVHGRYRSGPMAAQYERLYDDLMGLAHAA